MGDHAVTHCAPRLRKVIDGEQGGVSQSESWQGGGGFRFYRLGPPVFDEEGHIRSDIRFPVLASHIWFSEADRPWDGDSDSPLLGIHEGRAYALLYNGILGDKRPQGGNVLTRATLAIRVKTGKADMGGTERRSRAGPWRSSCNRQRRCASEARRSSGQLGRSWAALYWQIASHASSRQWGGPREAEGRG